MPPSSKTHDRAWRYGLLLAELAGLGQKSVQGSRLTGRVGCGNILFHSLYSLFHYLWQAFVLHVVSSSIAQAVSERVRRSAARARC